MDFIVFVGFLAAWIGVWRWLALRMGRNGNGWFVRHLTGISAGAIAGFFVVAISLSVGIISPEKKEIEEVVLSNGSESVKSPELMTADVPVEPIKSLGVTPDEYADRLNKIFKSVDMKYRINTKGIVKGEVNDTLNAPIGKYAGLVLSISKVNGHVLGVTLIGAGDGSPSSGLDIMMVASAALAAAAPAVEFKEVLRGLPELIGGQDHTYGNVKLSVMKMDQMGTWFFASPI